VENALLVLHWTQSLASVTCFSQQGQDVRINSFFCVNVFLCCTSVSSPMPAICSCLSIRLRHVLRLSNCPMSFTLIMLTLPLLLTVHASTLSAILYSAAASGNLMSVSSSSSARESSDLNSLVCDAWLVAYFLFFQLLRVQLLVLTIRLVLWCGLLSCKEGKTLVIHQTGVGRGIHRLFGEIYFNYFFNPILFTVSLCVLGMYTLCTL